MGMKYFVWIEAISQLEQLPKIEYEEFLEAMHRLRLAYIAVLK